MYINYVHEYSKYLLGLNISIMKRKPGYLGVGVCVWEGWI